LPLLPSAASGYVCPADDPARLLVTEVADAAAGHADLPVMPRSRRPPGTAPPLARAPPRHRQLARAGTTS
jgi:hypothetical protein